MSRPLYIRVVVVGDDNVGKGSLVANYSYQDIDDDHVVLGVETSFNRQVIGNREVQFIFNVIDAREDFADIRYEYLGTDIAMLVYDVTKQDSLDNLENIWSKEIQQANPPREYRPPVKMIIVANKCDLKNKREVDTSEGEETTRKIGAVKHVETCALEHDQKFESFLYELVRDYLDLKFKER